MLKLSTIIGAGMLLAIGTAKVNAETESDAMAPTFSCASFLKAAQPHLGEDASSRRYNIMFDQAVNYLKSLPHVDKLGYGSSCHLGNDLLVAECRLHRNFSVLDAIYSLMSEAETGKKLPGGIVCGA